MSFERREPSFNQPESGKERGIQDATSLDELVSILGEKRDKGETTITSGDGTKQYPTEAVIKVIDRIISQKQKIERNAAATELDRALDMSPLTSRSEELRESLRQLYRMKDLQAKVRELVNKGYESEDQE